MNLVSLAVFAFILCTSNACFVSTILNHTECDQVVNCNFSIFNNHALLHDRRLFLVPDECKSFALHLVCHKVYPSCQTDGVGIMYQQNQSCYEYMKLLGVTHANITASITESFVNRFTFPSIIAQDYCNSSRNCGVCRKVTKTWMFSGRFDEFSTIRPLTPIANIKKITETYLSNALSSVYLVADDECYAAIQTFLCEKYFAWPVQVSLDSIMKEIDLDSSISYQTMIDNHIADNLWTKVTSLPSGPSDMVTAAYKHKCATVMPLLQSLSPAFAIDSHSILEQHKRLLVENILGITPQPQQLVSNASYLRCPAGFVVPTDATDTRVRWVANSHCAQACRSPVWTLQEWKISKRVSLAASVTCAALMLCFSLLWICDSSKKKQHLILALGLLAGVRSLALLAAAVHVASMQCVSNAVPVDAASSVTLCSAQAFVLLYCDLAIAVAWTVQALDLYFKIVLNTQFRVNRFLQLGCILLLPLVSLGYLLGTKSLGFSGTLPWCTVSDGQDWAAVHLPVLVVIATGLCAMLNVLYSIYKTNWARSVTVEPSVSVRSISSRSESSVVSAVTSVVSFAAMKSVSDLRMVRTSLLFVLLFSAIWAGEFVRRIWEHQLGVAVLQQSLAAWTACVFQHYDGISDSSWQASCGLHPQERVPWPLALWGIVSVCSMPLAIFFTFIWNATVPNCIYCILVHMGMQKKRRYEVVADASSRRRSSRNQVMAIDAGDDDYCSDLGNNSHHNSLSGNASSISGSVRIDLSGSDNNHSQHSTGTGTTGSAGSLTKKTDRAAELLEDMNVLLETLR